jgi:hypothetical protein
MTYTLASSIGLDKISFHTENNEGDKFSIKWGSTYIDAGYVTKLEGDTITVVIDYIDADKGTPVTSLITGSDSADKVLFFVSYAELGNLIFDSEQHAEGKGTQAVLEGTHAEGRGTKAIGRGGHSEGKNTIAVDAAHAEGNGTQALGWHSHTEGEGTIATAKNAHTEGTRTKAAGVGAHAEGDTTTAQGAASHSEGTHTETNGVAAHAEGYYTHALNEGAHSEGRETYARGKASHAEGAGSITEIDAYAAHAEGQSTASGNTSHAEGYGTKAKGQNSHSEGHGTEASGQASHAEGYWTVANGSFSHAGGQQTKANYKSQTAIGKFNDNKENTLFEVGNGTGTSDDERSNAFEVYVDGHAEVQTQGETDNSVVIKSHLDKNINALDNVLVDILAAIQLNKSDAETIDAIEQTIVSYLETKTVVEVEE